MWTDLDYETLDCEISRQGKEKEIQMGIWRKARVSRKRRRISKRDSPGENFVSDETSVKIEFSVPGERGEAAFSGTETPLGGETKINRYLFIYIYRM